MLGPTVISLLEVRRKVQDEDREKLGDAWPTIEYDDEQLDLVFTAANGSPMLRQKVDKAIRTAADKAGVDAKGLGTHAGRRSVVTNLFASGLARPRRRRPLRRPHRHSHDPQLRPARRRTPPPDQRQSPRTPRPELDGRGLVGWLSSATRR